MLYLTNPTTASVRNAMATGLIAAMMSPRQGSRLPADPLFAIDKQLWPPQERAAGTGYPGDERYLGLVRNLIEADSADPHGLDNQPLPVRHRPRRRRRRASHRFLWRELHLMKLWKVQHPPSCGAGSRCWHWARLDAGSRRR